MGDHTRMLAVYDLHQLVYAFAIILALGAIYVGKYWGGDPTTVTYFAIPGYTRIDSALYYKWKRYSMALNIQNLMDRRYIQNEQSAEYVVPGEERKITLSITTRL